MQAYLERIHAVNPAFNAIVSLRDDAVLLQQADERDAQLARGESMGWMHGMPQAIKDLSNAAGIATTLGSPLMRDFIPAEDGLMTRRMKAAGCIVIGKTNVPEFGLGSHTFNDVFGPTRNAYDPARVCRRQQRRRSCGAGAALAAGGRRLGLHGQPAQPGSVEQRVRAAPLPRPCADGAGAGCLGVAAGHRRSDGAHRAGRRAAAVGAGRLRP